MNISKNNAKSMSMNCTDDKQRFALRKLSIGVASVLLGTTFYLGNNTVVHADVNNTTDSNNTVETNNSTINEDKWDTNQTAADNIQTQTMMADPIAPQQAELKTTNNSNSFVNANNNQYQASAIQTNNVTTNGGFDQATWGTLDVSKWTGQIVNNQDIDGVTRQYYELTGYTGDLNHIIIPNEADLEAAGINTGGHQVGINANMTHSWFENGDPKTIAFSKTDNKMVKALGSNWTSAFTGAYDKHENYVGGSHALGKFDGASLIVSNVINMNYMFCANQISDLKSLANWQTDKVIDMSYMFSNNEISSLVPLANWKTDKIIDMSYMFSNNEISNLAPLANWKTDNVTYMNNMFYNNQISNLSPLASWKTDNVINISRMFSLNQISDLSPLTSWKTNNVTDVSGMFNNNQISDLSPLASWKTNNVTDVSGMFNNNQISDLSPLANWKTNNVTNMGWMFFDNLISDLTPLANWKTDKVTDMSYMFGSNRIKLADFRKWDLNQLTSVNDLINNNENAIILTNSTNKKLLSTNGIISTTPNSISINSDSTDMPTLYATNDMTTPAEELAERLVKQTRTQKIADYQKAHPTVKISLVTPDPTNHAYDAPAILANQKYQAIEPVTVTYQYADDDNNQAIISTAGTIKALPETTEVLTFTLPKNYQLAANQSLPETVIMPSNNQTINIHLIHQTTIVDYSHPQTPGSAIDHSDPNSVKYPDGVSKDQLIHNINRTINYTKADGTIIHPATKDYVSFYRRLVIDKVTGKIRNSSWTNNQTSFPSINAPKLAGYTPNKDIISDSNISPDHADIIETVVYTPNNQNLTINYIDLTGNVVSHDDQIHKTDENVTVIPTAPTNYKLLMSTPLTMHIQPQDNVIDIPVAPQLIFRSHTNAANTDLLHTITRTITINTPTQGQHTVIQSVIFYRDDYENAVTKAHNYTQWMSDNDTFKAYIPTLISGYTPDTVTSKIVKETDPNSQVSVSYTSVSTSTYPKYIDINGHGYQTLPSGYNVVPGQDNKKGSLLIIKPANTKVTPVEYVTRTITIIIPNHQTRTIIQKARKGTKFLAAHLPHLKGFTTKITVGGTYGVTDADNDMNVKVEFTKTPLTES